MSEIEAKSIENNETDCDNPISLDEIEKGLWLGTHFHLIKNPNVTTILLIQCIIHFSGGFTAAVDVATLKQRNITHVLTLDICPLPVHITELPFLRTKYVHGRK